MDARVGELVKLPDGRFGRLVGYYRQEQADLGLVACADGHVTSALEQLVRIEQPQQGVSPLGRIQSSAA